MKPAWDGLREWRRNRRTGTRVGVYDGAQAGMDVEAGRWQTVCEAHGAIISHRTLALARHHAAAPDEWCDTCAGAAGPDDATTCAGSVGPVPGVNTRPDAEVDKSTGAEVRFRHQATTTGADDEPDRSPTMQTQQTTTTGVTVITTHRGDFVAHLAGCRDIKRSHDYGTGNVPGTYEAASLLDAIKSADTDMADWFCQTVYDPAPVESPWHIGGIEWAPCFTDAVNEAGIVFSHPKWNDETGAQPAAVPSIPSAESTKENTDMTTTVAPKSRKVTRREAIKSGRKVVASGMLDILAGTADVDDVTKAALAALDGMTDDTMSTEQAVASVEAAIESESMGPVVNPDGTPTDVTLAILTGDPAAKARARKSSKALAAAVEAAEESGKVVVAKRERRGKTQPVLITADATKTVLITMTARDAVEDAADADPVLRAAVAAGTYVRPNGQAPKAFKGGPGRQHRYYPRWRLAIVVPSAMDVQGSVLTTVRESAAGAPALPAAEKVARVRKAKAVIEAIDAMPGPEAVKAIGSDEAQAALAVIHEATVGTAHADDLPF